MVRPERFELPSTKFVACDSSQLSDGRLSTYRYSDYNIVMPEWAANRGVRLFVFHAGASTLFFTFFSSR